MHMLFQHPFNIFQRDPLPQNFHSILVEFSLKFGAILLYVIVKIFENHHIVIRGQPAERIQLRQKAVDKTLPCPCRIFPGGQYPMDDVFKELRPGLGVDEFHLVQCLGIQKTRKHGFDFLKGFFPFHKNINPLDGIEDKGSVIQKGFQIYNELLLPLSC